MLLSPQTEIQLPHLLVEERLENNDFIAGFNEAHKGTQHAYKYKTKSVSHQ